MGLCGALAVTLLAVCAGCQATVQAPPTAMDRVQRQECRKGNLASCLIQCNRGHGKSCYKTALAYRTGESPSISQSGSKYRYYLERACTMRYPDACFEMGRHILWYQEEQCDARTARCDKTRVALGRKLITSACQRGSVRACRLLAAALTSGELFFERDPGRAGRYRQKACLLGHRPSCVGP